MEDIKESLKILANVEKHRVLLDEFARSKYNEFFKKTNLQHGIYHSYSNFDIISETKIRVNFIYGGGDMDFNDNVMVNVKCYEDGTLDLRDKKKEYRIIVPDKIL